NRRRSSCGWSRTSVKPASCSTVQKRLLRLEKLWPAPAALAAGFRPQKITSRPRPRISASYLIKLHARQPARRVATQRAPATQHEFHPKRPLAGNSPYIRKTTGLAMERKEAG